MAVKSFVSLLISHCRNELVLSVLNLSDVKCIFPCLVFPATEASYRLLRFILKEDTHIPMDTVNIMSCWWWSGDARNQGLSNQSTDISLPEYCRRSTKWYSDLVLDANMQDNCAGTTHTQMQFVSCFAANGGTSQVNISIGYDTSKQKWVNLMAIIAPRSRSFCNACLLLSCGGFSSAWLLHGLHFVDCLYSVWHQSTTSCARHGHCGMVTLNT